MKPKKSCSNCIKGTSISINSDILCRDKGIVSPDYVCIKHRFMPESKSNKASGYKCIDCVNFITESLSPDNTSTIGLCRLFSVRTFDGTQKNACSKFVRDSSQEVS